MAVNVIYFLNHANKITAIFFKFMTVIIYHCRTPLNLLRNIRLRQFLLSFSYLNGNVKVNAAHTLQLTVLVSQLFLIFHTLILYSNW